MEDIARANLIRRARRALKNPAFTLPTIPGVQSLALATRYLGKDGRATLVQFIQMAVLNNHDAACKWWVAYSGLSAAEQAVVSFDDVCAASGVRPSQLVAAVVTVAMDHATDVGNLVAAVAHPAIVEAAVKSATRVSDDQKTYSPAQEDIAQEDRRMLFSHARFIPLPKNVGVEIHNQQSTTHNTAVVAVNGTGNGHGEGHGQMPSFLADAEAQAAAKAAVQHRVAGVIDQRLGLPPASAPETFEGEIVRRSPRPVVTEGTSDW